MSEQKRGVEEGVGELIKKKISHFIKSEKGSVSKKALIDGALAAGLIFVLSQAVSGDTHSDNVKVKRTIRVDYSPDTATGVHSNHSSHSSHSSY